MGFGECVELGLCLYMGIWVVCGHVYMHWVCVCVVVGGGGEGGVRVLKGWGYQLCDVSVCVCGWYGACVNVCSHVCICVYLYICV